MSDGIEHKLVISEADGKGSFGDEIQWYGFVWSIPANHYGTHLGAWQKKIYNLIGEFLSRNQDLEVASEPIQLIESYVGESKGHMGLCTRVPFRKKSQRIRKCEE